MSRNPEKLIEQGKLAEAAALLLERGEAARAAGLFEQLWDYAAAARAALAADDPARALQDAVRAKDAALEQEALEALRRAAADDPAALASAAVACEARGAWGRAAQLHRLAGDLDSAARCHVEAGSPLEAGRVLEQAGRIKEAVARYREFLFQAGEETGGEETVRCRLDLGLLLLRHGRHDEALPQLQRAWSAGLQPMSRQAGQAVVAGLHRLGYSHAAREALLLLNEADSGHPILTLEECLEDPLLAPGAEDGEAARVLAGRYRLGKLLGAGGMGSVYEAVDLLGERTVAVKVFTAPAGARGRDAFLRFVREARAMGELRHPHVVSLLDFNEELGFMVLEHMAGTLGERLRPTLPLQACREVMEQLISGLAAAHQRGIVHRDIKPSNIFFTAAGAVKLGDFGVAHLQDSGQTQTGAFIGTLAYMAPEQITGEQLTFACDLYALGVLLHRLVCGALPFAPPDLVGKHLRATPPRPSAVRPGLPVAYDEVVLRCLAKRPGDRHGSLQELLEAVRALPLAREQGAGDGHAWPAEEEPAEPAPTQEGERYRVHGGAQGDGVQLLHGEDLRLGREVLVVRAPSGEAGRRALALLRAAAGAPPSAETRPLQAVLDLDEARGEAVLAVTRSDGEPRPGTRAERLELCWQIALALAPLHRAGLAHGALSEPGSVACRERLYSLLLAPALSRQGAPEPAQDLLDLRALSGLDDAPDGDAAELARWAADRLKELAEAEEKQQREALHRQALAHRPEEAV